MCLEHLLRAIAVAISGEPFELRPWVPRHCVCETRPEPALLLEYGFMIDESVLRPPSIYLPITLSMAFSAATGSACIFESACVGPSGGFLDTHAAFVAGSDTSCSTRRATSAWSLIASHWTPVTIPVGCR